MKSRLADFPSVCVLILALASPLLNASPVSSLSKAVMKFFTKEVAEEGVEKVSKEVGELAAKHGPDVIRALDNAPAPAKLVRVLNELPAEEVSSAAACLASGSRGKQLAKATEDLGVDVLRAEVKHPGVGMEFVRAWPDGGGHLCRRLSTDEAITLGKYLDDLAEVPPDQRKGLLEIINADKDRFFAWLGKFVEANPGRTIGSATFLAAFLPNAERILGGDEIVYDAEGNPIVVRKPGMLGAPASKLADAVASGIFWLLCAVAAVVTLWLAQILLVRGWWNGGRR